MQRDEAVLTHGCSKTGAAQHVLMRA
jgi:hypothetical protein